MLVLCIVSYLGKVVGVVFWFVLVCLLFILLFE